MKKAIAFCNCFFQLYSPYGEWYCCAVIFGFLPSDIRFASARANIISLCRRHNITFASEKISRRGRLSISLSIYRLMYVNIIEILKQYAKMELKFTRKFTRNNKIKSRKNDSLYPKRIRFAVPR